MHTRIGWLRSAALVVAAVMAIGPRTVAQDKAARIPAGNSASGVEAKVDQYVRPYLEMGCFSGAVLIAKGGKVLLSKGYGMANYELSVPNTPRTRFHIASLSKPFTAAAILLLEEQGRLSVRDPLSRFLPDYPNGNAITIHHLISHRSGIPNVNSFPDYDEKSKSPQTLDSIIRMFKNKPLEFAPGEKYRYSNSNYNLLAFIIEKVSGLSYEEFLARNIFQPLGMADTGHDGDPRALVPSRAMGYVPAALGQVVNAPYLDWSIKTGNGSLYSTVEDLYKWDRALYTEKVLKKATLEKMFAEPYAWFTGKAFNRRVFRYGGRSPGFTSSLARFVDDDLCIVVTSNNYSVLGQSFEEPLAAIVFGEKYEAPPRAVRLSSEVLSRLTGRYQFGPDFYTPNATWEIVRQGDVPALVAGGSTVALLPLAENELLDRMFGGRMVFQKDETGQIKGLVYRSGRDFRAARLP